MPATFGQRAFGYFIDTLTVGILVSLVRFIAGDVPIWDAPAVGVLSFFLYKVVTETLWGTTIGKLGLKVVAEKYPALITAVIRNSWLLVPGLVMLLDVEIGQFFGSVALVVLISSLYRSKDFRSTFDRWAGARVIDRKQ